MFLNRNQPMDRCPVYFVVLRAWRALPCMSRIQARLKERMQISQKAAQLHLH